MKKKCLRILSTALCLTVGGTTLASCTGGSKFDNGEQSLSVWVCDAGYGTAWLDNALALFAQQDWVKSTYPELKTNVVKNNTDGLFGFKTTNAGPAANEYDLIVSSAPGGEYFSSGQFEEMTKVYDSQVPGESVTLREKMIDGIYEQQGYEQLDNTVKFYGVPWVVGTMGLFYNQTVLERAFPNGYELPNTTDELLQFCKDLKTKNETPIISASSANYWIEMFKIWWAQYEGLENYTNFWYGIVDDEYDSAVTGQLGRKYSLLVLDSLLNAGNGLIHEESTLRDYITMQTYFMEGYGAIMCNGDWLANEMEDEDSSAIRMMKTPVNSYIIEKCASVKTDEKLSFVVSCVDAGDTYQTAKEKYAEKGYGDLTQADFNAIEEARLATFSYGGLGYHVPTYASAKNVALDFIRFCATDIAIQSLVSTGKGFKSPYAYAPTADEKAGFNSLSKDAWENQERAKYIPPHTMFRLFCYGGLIPLRTTVNAIDSVFMAENEADRFDPVTIYERDFEYYTANNDKNWNAILQKAGI